MKGYHINMNNKFLFRHDFFLLSLLFFPFSAVVTELKNPYNNLFKKVIQIFLALSMGMFVHLWLYMFIITNFYLIVAFLLISAVGTLLIISSFFKEFSKTEKLLLVPYLLFIIYWWSICFIRFIYYK